MDKNKMWLGVFFIIIFVFAVIIWMKDIRRLEEENQQLQMYISAMEDFYLEIKDKIDATRKYRHDLAKHIQTMEQLLLTYQDEHVISERMEELKTEYRQMEKMEFSNHEIINAICQIKNKECQEKNIRFYTEISSISDLPVSEIDMVGLLQNLLDNGIEACGRMDDTKKKSMILEIQNREKSLEICLKNTYDQSVPLNFQTRKKNKEEHGFGVRIIQEIVNMAQGELQYISEGDYLMTYVILPYRS